MTTVDEMRAEIYEGLGGRDDSVIQEASLRGLNAGCYSAFLLFQPPECRVRADLNCGSSDGWVSYSTALTRPFRFEAVRNTDDADKKVWPVEFNLWDILRMPTSGSIQFFALYGTDFYYKPIPSASETVRIWYMQYPARLTAGDGVIPYPKHEDYILSIAQAFSFLVLEEDQSAGVWNQLADRFGIPDLQLSQIQRMMRGEVDVDYLSRVLSKSSE